MDHVLSKFNLKCLIFQNDCRYNWLMSQNEIQKIIEAQIPITKSTGIQFISFQESTCFCKAPLQPNHNHKGTAFGGSLYNTCITASYGLIFNLQRINQITQVDLVVASANISYLRPVDQDFQIKSTLDPIKWNQMTLKLNKQGFGKIDVEAFVFITDESVRLCEFKGTFVFKKSK